MTQDEINYLAIRGIIGLAIITALLGITAWATAGSAGPVLVAGATTETTMADEDPAGDVASNSTSTTGQAPVSTTSTTVAETTTTTWPPSTTTRISTTTTPATSSSTGTTATIPPSTTTSSTTGAVATTTSTTTVPTTTTTSTTTTIPPTTTTTSTTTTPLPGVLLHKFEGHDHGDVGGWEAHIKIEIRDGDAEGAAFATVLVEWAGSRPGSQLLSSGKDGKIDTRIGNFSDTATTLRITDVRLAGFAYRPALNAVSSTLLIQGPT